MAVLRYTRLCLLPRAAAAVVGFTLVAILSLASASLTVTNTDDTGSGSLRQTIAEAASGETLVFDASLNGQVIILSSGAELVINKDLAIDATSLPEGIRISGDSNNNGVHDVSDTRIFNIFPGGWNVVLKSIQIERGYVHYDSPTAPDGGAIYKHDGTLLLEKVTLRHNSALRIAGALFNSLGSVTINDCTFSDNSGSQGGAVGQRNNTMILNRSTFFRNSASSQGGAIFQNGGGLLLHHCTLTENSTPGVGGAIASQYAFTMNHTTVTRNVATRGGGVAMLSSQTIALSHSILTGNQASLFVDVWSSSPPQDNGHNLMSGDPVLAPLGDYGGPTQTMPLLPGSPALDAGMASDPGGTDQRGFSRFLGPAVDIGAVETQDSNDSRSVVSSAWTTNLDGDANPFGVEFALGTGIGSSDPAHPRAFRIVGMNGFRQPKLTFGFNIAALPYMSWIVKRSTTLVPHSFTEIYRYHGPTMTEITTNTSARLLGDLLEVIDINPSPEGAFYRFEAEIEP